MRRSALAFMCLAVHCVLAASIDRPPMGWASDVPGCAVTAEDVIEAADALVRLNLAMSGFTYVLLGDCWQAPTRTSAGLLQADPARFPDGIKPLAEHVHALGLRFGITTAAGARTSADRPGSLGYHKADAALFASWGVDFVHLQGQGLSADEFHDSTQTFKAAMDAAGMDGPLSLAYHPNAKTWAWGDKPHAIWATYSRPLKSWDAVIQAVDRSRGLARYVKRNSYMNLGTLHLQGHTMTDAQLAATIAFFAVTKSALFISANLDELPSSTLDLLQHNELLGIASERGGIAADVAFQEAGDVVYAASLRNGDRIALLWNRREPENEEDAENPMTTQLRLPWRSLGVRSRKELVVRDVMRRQDLGVFHGSFSTTLAPHAFTLLRLSPRRGKLATWDTWTSAECDAEKEEVDEYHIEWSPGVVVFTTLFAVLTVLTLTAAGLIVRTVWQQRATLRQPRGTNRTYSRVSSTDT